MPKPKPGEGHYAAMVGKTIITNTSFTELRQWLSKNGHAGVEVRKVPPEATAHQPGAVELTEAGVEKDEER